MILKLIRTGLGQIIIFLNYLFRPQQKKRTPIEQARINQKTQSFALYQFHACPFCVRVRRMITQLNLKIEYRDAKNDTTHREALLAGGGKIKVPCLRIEENDQVSWLYESLDINAYLSDRF